MTAISRRELGPVPEAGPDHWWDVPLKMLRAVLKGMDWAATKLMKLLSYGAVGQRPQLQLLRPLAIDRVTSGPFTETPTGLA